MNKVRKSFVGVVTFCSIVFILSVGVIVLSIINVPRIVPNKKLKKSLGHISNRIGSKIVEIITASLQILHGLEWQFDIPEHLNTRTWYVAMSNHQSWADIFILLAAGHKKMPLLKFFMKKELQWIPIIYLVHKTIDMPFLNRHSQKQIEANPELKKLDYQNAETAAKNFLTPKIGALAIALKGMPQVNELIDFTVIYSTNKRSTWDFLCGEMSQAKVYAKAYQIPETLKGKNFDQEEEYRKEFKNFIEKIWKEKQELYTESEF